MSRRLIRATLEVTVGERPGAEMSLHASYTVDAPDMDEMLKKLEELHGITPPKRKVTGVFVDGCDGPVQVGFITRYWSQWEKPRRWYEVWVSFVEILETPVTLPKCLKAKP